MSAIRQWQKAVSANDRAGKTSMRHLAHEGGQWGVNNDISLSLQAVLRPYQWSTGGNGPYRLTGLYIEHGRNVLEQHSQHPLVRQVLKLDDERELSKALAMLARRYGADTTVQEAMTRLVAELLDLCGCELPDAPEGAEEGEGEGGTTIVKPPEEQPDSSGEERKKNTDEVDGSSQTGDETHGGDSASGEVPDAQSGGGEPQDESKGDGDGESQGKATADEIAEIAEAQQALKKACRTQKRNSGAKGGQGNGVFAEFGNLDRSLVRHARAALSALVSSGASELSPRYDHTELVKRLVSHRPLQPARREETGRPVILVIADVSGSCASFAEPACDVAQACGAVGVAGADVVTVRCFNVWKIIEVRVNNHPIEFDTAQITTPAAFAAWIVRIVGGQIEVVIGLGDSDEYTTYEEFALLPFVERLIWLDNYSSNVLDNTPTRQQRIAANWRGEGSGTFAPVARRKLTYMIGCGDAQAMVKGLEMTLRSH